MPRAIVPAAVAIAGIVLLWWLTFSASTPRPGRGSPATANAAAPASDVVARGVAETDEGALPERVPASEASTTATSVAGTTLRVQVIDAVTGRPVAGATVRGWWAFDGDTDVVRRLLERWRIDPEAGLREFGAVARTDEDGTVDVPRTEPLQRRIAGTAWFGSGLGRTLVARKGELYGDVVVRDAATEATIELQRDLSADVIVYAAGRPEPGVHVWHRVATRMRDLGEGRTVMGVTGDDGRFVLAHLQQRVLGDEQVSEVLVHEPGIELAPVALDCMQPPAASIRFDLPACGGLVVEVRRPDGVLAMPAGSVVVEEEGDDSLDGACGQDLHEGRAVFDHVGLGKTFRVTWEFGGWHESRRVDGPTRPEQVVSLVIEPTPQPVLVGRLRLPDGTPLRSAPVQLTVTADSKADRLIAYTDDGGAFERPGNAELLDARLQRVRLSLSQLTPERNGMVAEAAPADVVLRGRVDLGTLTLRDPPLFARGRILRSDGSPARASFLKLESLGGEAAPDLDWRMLQEGEFELRGASTADAVRVVAVAVGGRLRQQEPVVVARGAGDVRLVLIETGSITATFTHPPGEEYRLDCVMQPMDGGEPAYAFLFPTETAAGTRYAFSALTPGAWRFIATLPGASAPCVTIDGIEVHGGKNDDPRLDGIVLPDVATLTIELRDARGELLERVDGQLYVRDHGSDAWVGRYFMAARTSLLTRPGPTDVVIVVPGHRPIRRLGVQGTVVVHLESLSSAVSMHVIVDGAGDDAPIWIAAEPVEGAEHYRIGLYGKTVSEGPAPWLSQVATKSGATVTVPVDGPGRYRIRVLTGGGPGSATELPDVEPETFVVPDPGTTPTIEVHARLPR